MPVRSPGGVDWELKPVVQRASDELEGMGHSLSHPDPQTVQIDKELRDDWKRCKTRRVLLLHGAPDTVALRRDLLAQFRLAHSVISNDELVNAAPKLRCLALKAMQEIIGASDALHPTDQLLSRVMNATELDQQTARDVSVAWHLPAIRASYHTAYHMSRNVPYLLDNVERIASASSLSAEDLRRCPSWGGSGTIEEVEFESKGHHFAVIDAGTMSGKSLLCFEDSSVQVVVFVVAMDCYNCRIKWDSNFPAMREARQVFGSIADSSALKNLPIALVFANADRFAEMLKSIDMRIVFADYRGGSDCKAAYSLLRHKFTALNRRYGRATHTYVGSPNRTSLHARQAALQTVLTMRAMGLPRDMAVLLARYVFRTRLTDPEAWLIFDTDLANFLLFDIFEATKKKRNKDHPGEDDGLHVNLLSM